LNLQLENYHLEKLTLNINKELNFSDTHIQWISKMVELNLKTLKEIEMSGAEGEVYFEKTYELEMS
jgi:hypothetical protein